MDTFFPNAQQKGSRFEVGGLGGWEFTRNPCGAFASLRKRPRPKIIAKRRTVVAFGLALRLRDSKVSTISGIGGVVVAKRRTERGGERTEERGGERKEERGEERGKKRGYKRGGERGERMTPDLSLLLGFA